MKILLVCMVVLSGCASVGLQGQLVRIQAGPAFGRDVRSIASLLPTCGAMESMNEALRTEECSRSMIAAVDRATVGFLRSNGVRTIRTVALNAATFEKLKAQRQAEDEEGAPEDWGGARVLFRSASPILQRQVLDELNVDGVLRTRLLVGAGVGMSQRRNITALITLFGRDGSLVWASRCEREVSLTVSAGDVTYAIATGDVIETTMCALEEATSL